MKNKSILSIWNAASGSIKKEKGHKNFVRGMLVMAVVALCATSFVEAAQRGRSKTPQKRSKTPQKRIKAAPQVTPQTGALVTTGTIDPERWQNIKAGLQENFAKMTPSKMLEFITKVRGYSLTQEQSDWLDVFEDKVSLKRKIQTQQSQIIPLMLQQEQAGVMVPKKTEATGWLGNLWDYESSLASWIPTTATGGALAGLAAYFALPAVVGYLSWGLAAKLGLMAAGTDRIFYAYKQGALTESGAVDALKELIKNELEDEGRYPTLASKAEALSVNEFPGIKDKDPRIVALALQALRTEITQTMQALKDNRERDSERVQENIIVALVAQLRQEFGFTENRNAEEYAKKLEHPKEFITAHMTDSNAVAVIRAICSELLRIKAIVAIMKAEFETKKQPLPLGAEGEEVPEGSEKAGQTGLAKTAREWWRWMTVPTTGPLAK